MSNPLSKPNCPEGLDFRSGMHNMALSAVLDSHTGTSQRGGALSKEAQKRAQKASVEPLLRMLNLHPTPLTIRKENACSQ
eukprot:597652-Pelagomonas_calceolata.AAC.1